MAAEQVSRRLCATPASWRPRCICTWTATTSARTRSRTARSRSTRRTARSCGSTCWAPARRPLISWTSSYSETGVLGEAELATAEKGRVAYEEAVKQLVRFITWFKDRPKDVRRDRHRTPPTMPIPWGQRPVGAERGRSAGVLVHVRSDLGRRRPTHSIADQAMKQAFAGSALRLARILLDLGPRAQAVGAGAQNEVVPKSLRIHDRARLPHQLPVLAS